MHEIGHNINLAHSGLNGATGNTVNMETTRIQWGIVVLSGAMLIIIHMSLVGLHQVFHLVTLILYLGLLQQRWAGGTTYWLQLKSSHTYDQYMSSSWMNNVQIKRCSDTSTYERADDMAEAHCRSRA